MSLVIASPETLAAAATGSAGIGSTINAANASAAVPTTELVAAAASEVSVQIAVLFGAHARNYQAIHEKPQRFTTGLCGP